jgi:mRNA-degrading endonuclease YafQ of YafQ-DinJ toxin-antitoxin module
LDIIKNINNKKDIKLMIKLEIKNKNLENNLRNYHLKESFKKLKDCSARLKIITFRNNRIIFINDLFFIFFF